MQAVSWGGGAGLGLGIPLETPTEPPSPPPRPHYKESLPHLKGTGAPRLSARTTVDRVPLPQEEPLVRSSGRAYPSRARDLMPPHALLVLCTPAFPFAWPPA
jgi:hypothetical protein